MPEAVEGTQLFSYKGKSKSLLPPENCDLEGEVANKCINNIYVMPAGDKNWIERRDRG